MVSMVSFAKPQLLDLSIKQRERERECLPFQFLKQTSEIQSTLNKVKVQFLHEESASEALAIHWGKKLLYIKKQKQKSITSFLHPPRTSGCLGF